VLTLGVPVQALRIFEAHRVTEEAFRSNPSVLYAADALYKIGDRCVLRAHSLSFP
jgi:hypothetical protein